MPELIWAEDVTRSDEIKILLGHRVGASIGKKGKKHNFAVRGIVIYFSSQVNLNFEFDMEYFKGKIILKF